MNNRARTLLVWVAIALAITIPLIAAATSPLLQWRDPVYIIAGFAGVTGLALLLIQPLLAATLLPGFTAIRSRRIHRWIGMALVAAVIIHVIGLWITSPPDVIDALLFASPTAFSVWGVIAMWCVFISAGLAMFRRKLQLPVNGWRLIHKTLAMVIVVATTIHAVKIDGTMELVSKAVLCGLVLLATAIALITLSRR